MSDSSGNSRLDDVVIEVRRRHGAVHAWCGTYGLFASAATADEAVAIIDGKLRAMQAFEAQSGLGAGSRLPVVGGTPRSRFLLGRIGISVLVGGLVAMQIGWAVSLGLSNGLGRVFNTKWRDGLVTSLEHQILTLAAPKAELGADEQARLIAAVRALKTRYGPVWDEIQAGRPEAAR